ncbi:MAG: hypothetical protein ACXVPU_01740 [Bacteroidia bacterium]
MQKLTRFLFLLFSFSTLSAQNNIDTASFNPLFKQVISDSDNIVVIGEAHVIKGTHPAELFIMNKLAEKGYKTIYIEGGEAEAKIMTMYFQTGDTTLLRYTRAMNDKEQKEFIQSWYQLNKEKNYQFVCRGFDFEAPVCFHYLFSKWFDTAKIENSELKQQVAQLLSIKGSISYTETKKMKKVYEIFENAKAAFPKYEIQYKELLKDNFETFKNIIFNPVTSDFSTRNEKMKALILQRAQEGDLNNVIFITGNHHLCYNKKEFIPALANELPDKYSFTVFPFIYKNCSFTTINKKYSSEKKFLNYLDEKDSDKTMIRFTKNEKQIVPSERKNIFTILVGVYNQ